MLVRAGVSKSCPSDRQYSVRIQKVVAGFSGAFLELVRAGRPAQAARWDSV